MREVEKKIILLVEDNPSDVELTRLAFEKANIIGNLIVVYDGIEAIEYLFGKEGCDNQVTPHLILLDLKLPRMDGFSVLYRIRSHDRTKHIPVIIVTTSNDEQTITRSYNTGANEFIHKSPGFGQFSESLSNAVRHWISESTGQKEQARRGFG
jgi:CheY-like chemotaxis protein